MVDFPKKPYSWKFIFCGIVLPIALLMGVSCSVLWIGQNAWEPPQLVSVEGKEEFAVFHWHGLKFFIPSQKGRATLIPVRDGELLLSDDEVFTMYRSSDGDSLAFSGNKVLATLNGRTVTAMVEEDEALNWLQRATPEELEDLRLLHMDNELNPQQIALLHRIAKVNPEVGLWVEEYKTFVELAGLFDPNWLLIGGSLQEQDLAILSKKKNIRTLAINDPGSPLTFLSTITNLDTLMIDNWDPRKTGPLPNNLPSLRRIVLIDPVITNLSALGKQPKLMELNLQNTKSLGDLTLLMQFPDLRLLSLHGTNKVRDLGPLKNLKHMQWLSLPEVTNQVQLVEIIQSLHDLVFLDLSDCEKITDLSPVQKLAGLQYLIVDIDQAGSDSLYKMKHLRWLAVTGKKGKVGEARIKKIQEALPDTDLVLLVPFCLGSGWILLVLPIIVSSWWITRRREKMGLCVHGNYG